MTTNDETAHDHEAQELAWSLACELTNDALSDDDIPLTSLGASPGLPGYFRFRVIHLAKEFVIDMPATHPALWRSLNVYVNDGRWSWALAIGAIRELFEIETCKECGRPLEDEES